MGFILDKSFPSLRATFDFIFQRYALRPNQRLWELTPSGLEIPHDAPQYLFRGENGRHLETMGAISRPQTYVLKDGRQLSDSDLDYLRQLMLGVHRAFKADSYSLDDHRAT